MEKLQVQVYSPHSSFKSPLGLIREIFKDLGNASELGKRFANRDIKSQYRQSILGILWAFITPAFSTLIWIFLSGTGIVKISNTSIPYPLYAFTGTMLWAIFADALNAPLLQTTNSKGILTKINFPREAIILSGIYQTMFNGFIKVILLLIASVAMGVYPDWHFLLFPIAFFSLIITGTAIGVLLTPVGTLYGDIAKALPLVLQLAMFVSPVLFPIPKSGWVFTLFSYNPLTPLIITSREWLTGFPTPYLNSFTLITSVFVVLFLLSCVVYRVSMPILIERMSA